MKLKDYLVSGKTDFYERTAKKILKNIKFSHPREIDIYSLCDQYGMIVCKTENKINVALPAQVERRGIIHIHINANEKEERELLAEEFSHLYLHQITQLSNNKPLKDKMEYQAFNLAANLLIPTDWLMNADVYHDQNDMMILVSEVADEFGVQPEFAYKRLKLLNNTYKFSRQYPAVVFENTFYGIPDDFFPKRIFVILDEETQFPLD